MVGGERLVDRAVRVLAEAGCSPVVVVLGAWQGTVPKATVVINEAWSTGMGSSLRAGLAWLVDQAPDIERVAITPVDLPGLTVPAVERLLGHSEPVVAGSYAGVRGHPVLITRHYWQQAMDMAEGDRGARDFLATRRDLVVVELGDVASGHDVDTREDLDYFDQPTQP